MQYVIKLQDTHPPHPVLTAHCLDTPNIFVPRYDAPFPSSVLNGSAHPLSSLGSMFGFKSLSKMDVLWVLRSYLSSLLLDPSSIVLLYSLCGSGMNCSGMVFRSQRKGREGKRKRKQELELVGYIF